MNIQTYENNSYRQLFVKKRKKRVKKLKFKFKMAVGAQRAKPRQKNLMNPGQNHRTCATFPPSRRFFQEVVNVPGSFK